MIKTYEDIVSYSNETPELLSLLYDLNLMPEQIESKDDKRAFIACVVGYALGKGVLFEHLTK